MQSIYKSPLYVPRNTTWDQMSPGTSSYELDPGVETPSEVANGVGVVREAITELPDESERGGNQQLNGTTMELPWKAPRDEKAPLKTSQKAIRLLITISKRLPRAEDITCIPPDDLTTQRVRTEYIAPMKTACSEEKFLLAVEILKRGLRRFPNNPHILNGFGQLAMGLKQAPLALRYFRRVVSFYPEDIDSYTSLAPCLILLKKLKEAKKIVLTGLRIDPDNEMLLALRAELEEREV